MSDNKDTQNDDVEFSQDELEELKKQGIDDAELDKIVKTVHDELSDNANEKSDDKDKNDDKDKEVKVDNHDTPNKDNQEDATAQTDNNTKVITSKTSKEASNPQKNDTKPDNLRQDRPTSIPISHQSTDNKKHDDLKNNVPAADEEAQKIEQQQADIVRMLIAKKHSQKTIDHKEVRINIEAGALPTKIFFMMNGLSAVIAGYGLLANSPAVVIGAMLVAMMLSPITSAALAVIDARLSLLKTSLITLIGGVFVIYVIGMGLGFLHGDNVMTAEILARTSPTTMDLMVALAGGAAGAYAIKCTNALVLWFAGFRRILNDDEVGKLGQIGLFLKRNSAVLIALIVVGGYLTVNFSKNLNEQKFERQSIALVEKSIQNQANYLVSHSFTHEGKKAHTLRVVIQGLITPNQAQAVELERQIQKLAKDTLDDRVIKLQIRFVPEVVIQSTPTDESELKLSPNDIKNLQ